MADIEPGMFDVVVPSPVVPSPEFADLKDLQQARSRSPHRRPARRELQRLLSVASSEWDEDGDTNRRQLAVATSEADDENSRWSVTAQRSSAVSATTTVSSFPSPCAFLWQDDPPSQLSLAESQAPQDEAREEDPPSLSVSSPPPVLGDIVKEVGNTGCIVPDQYFHGRSSNCGDGIVVDMGFEYLVRIALRCINISPRSVQERLVAKYGRVTRTTERIPTTYSGSDAIIDYKLAVITAVRLKIGMITAVDSFLSFSVVQTLAAEKDEWKRDRAIINKPRHPSHNLMHVAKAGFSFCVVESGECCCIPCYWHVS